MIHWCTTSNGTFMYTDHEEIPLLTNMGVGNQSVVLYFKNGSWHMCTLYLEIREWINADSIYSDILQHVQDKLCHCPNQPSISHSDIGCVLVKKDGCYRLLVTADECDFHCLATLSHHRDNNMGINPNEKQYISDRVLKWACRILKVAQTKPKRIWIYVQTTM